MARLTIYETGKSPREVDIYGTVTTFGRTPDNSISFPSDGGVSRYHAQIEQRGKDFFISDFGSSNGTTVNGSPVFDQPVQLNDGDEIVFGGSSRIVFHNAPETEQENLSNESIEIAESSEAKIQNPKSKFPLALTAAAVLSGLAIVTVAGAAIIWFSGIGASGGCDAMPEVSILSPENGATISEPTEIRVNAKNARCIERIVYLIDGGEIASAETQPFSATLEPENFEQFKNDDLPHVLTVAVYDRNGKKTLQKDELNLAFGDARGNEAADKPTDQKTGQTNAAATITLAETKAMAENLLKQFTHAAQYKFDPQFLREVQRRTNEFRTEGYWARASQYRDQINQAFVAEQGLDAPLGYVLAMSQSEFQNKKTGAAEGLWQMQADFAAANGYNGQCGTETLSDARQTCAARAAAIYTKALMNLFQNDLIYAVSTYGMSPADAGQFQLALPAAAADRADFWNILRNPKQRDSITRFFAAGIVAENPNKFGLRRDKPLSDLYKNLIIVK
jgi:pSer/pThr/pTyr-binding forkhead associated (FHA) protein